MVVRSGQAVRRMLAARIISKITSLSLFISPPEKGKADHLTRYNPI
jgi:hypothetical protein